LNQDYTVQNEKDEIKTLNPGSIKKNEPVSTAFKTKILGGRYVIILDMNNPFL